MLLRERVVLHSSEHAAEVLVEVLHDDEDVIEIPEAVLCLLGRDDDVDQLGRK